MIDTHRSWLKIIIPILIIISMAGLLLVKQSPNNTTQAQTNYCNVVNYGALGNGSNDDTNSIQAAINTCSSTPQSTVYFPPGIYMISDRIDVYSNMTLDLNNATIEGTDDFRDKRLLFADTISNFRIEGPGIIERGRGGVYIADKDEYWLHTVTIDVGNNIYLKDITITSENYHTHPGDGKELRGYHLQAWKSSNVTYENVTVRGHIEGGANDAIHISEGRDDITIIGGEGWSGDDPLVFHGPGDFSNITVDGTRVGGKTRGAILMTTFENSNTNMHFKNMTITEAISSERGAGIAFLPRGPNVKYDNISFTGITMDGDIQIPFNGIRACDYCGSVDLTGLEANNISFTDIEVRQENNIYYNHSRISRISNMNDVAFENVAYYFASWQTVPETLVEFSQINGLCINEFKVFKGNAEISNPLSRLDWTDNVSGLTTNQPCNPATIGKLDIDKSANKPQVSKGGTLTYTLSYKNNASVQFKNVVITDQIPDGASYVPGSASHGGQYASGQLIWNLGTVAAGAGDDITFDIKVD